MAYENTDPDKDREEGEAENLYRGTFAADPSAKVFVFAGGSHIMERPMEMERNGWQQFLRNDTA